MIVHIEEEMVYIKLHPQPVIRGRKVRRTILSDEGGNFVAFQRFDRETYAMKISNVEKFEEKLRKVEADLHIDPATRILVSYTRNR